MLIMHHEGRYRISKRQSVCMRYCKIDTILVGETNENSWQIPSWQKKAFKLDKMSLRKCAGTWEWHTNSAGAGVYGETDGWNRMSTGSAPRGDMNNTRTWEGRNRICGLSRVYVHPVILCVLSSQGYHMDFITAEESWESYKNKTALLSMDPFALRAYFQGNGGYMCVSPWLFVCLTVCVCCSYVCVNM